MQQLQAKSGSGVVTIPKAKLRQDDILDDGEIPPKQGVAVDRLGRRSYLVRFPDDGELPDLCETDVVQRAAAQLALSRDGNRVGQPAD